MAYSARKAKYQTTTVRMPTEVYEKAKNVVQMCEEISSVNEFIVEAVKDKLREISEAEIDAAFAEMANDPDYQRESIKMAKEFEKSDWDAFQVGQAVDDDHANSTITKEVAHARAR